MIDGLLDSERSALLLVDLQERLLPAIDDGQNVVAAADWLAAVAIEQSVPIYATVQAPERLGATVEPLAARILAGRLFEKTCFCWSREPQAATLELPKQVVVVGTEAHVCVLQTALGLLAAGHEVFVVAEAIGSRRAADRLLAIERLRHAGVVVMGAEMAAFEWLQRAGTDAFRRLLPQLRDGWRRSGC